MPMYAGQIEVGLMSTSVAACAFAPKLYGGTGMGPYLVYGVTRMGRDNTRGLKWGYTERGD